MWVHVVRWGLGWAAQNQAYLVHLSACLSSCRPACRFAEYRKDDPASFLLHQNLSYFPQFMFNMRRSPFVQVGEGLPQGGGWDTAGSTGSTADTLGAVLLANSRLSVSV